jgi:Domain of unknown function (DUF1992)
MTERKPPGMSWETWVESQIARGLARGDFDDLPGAGRPLPGLDREQTSYDWALAWARRENAEVTGLLPPGLALRRERELLPGVVVRLPSEAAVRALGEDFNARVEQFWRRPVDGPPVAVGQIAVDDLVQMWRSARRAATAPAPRPDAGSPGGAPKKRWFRLRRPG